MNAKLRSVFFFGCALAACLGLSARLDGAILDLTGGGFGFINGARFDTNVVSGTGTGNFGSFVRIDGGSQAHAYNTTQHPVFDNTNDSTHNKSIQKSDVPVEVVDGVTYRRLAFDMAEPGSASGRYLSLDEVQLFIGTNANVGVTTFTAGILDHPDGPPVYRLDTPTVDNWIALDSTLNGGGGSGDLFFYVPDTVFASYPDTAIVTLYSSVGEQGSVSGGGVPDGNYGAGGSFEEWGVPAVVVPEPDAVVMALCVCALWRRSRRR